LTRREAGRRVALVAGLALVGAFAFGAWHVVVGGGLHGNPRAAAFGAVLAGASGIGLVAIATVARRMSAGRSGRG
jgi:hypothetical protein